MQPGARTRIPQSNPAAGYQAQKPQIDAAIARVMESGWYILGQEVADFERRFADYIGVNSAVGVATGTDAIEVSLRACGIGPGDAVFTVSHTAVGTVVGIERTGASAVLVDIDPNTYTMSPERLEEAVRSSTADTSGRPAAVVPVHLYGHVADMPAINDIAQRHGLRVIEDCAQAHGSAGDGRKAGAWGDAAAFSFYPTKNLGAFGDGGTVVTNDRSVAKRAREIREYGWRDRYVSASTGINSRLDELQAAILSARLATLDQNNDQRRRIATAYAQGLADTSLRLPATRRGAEHVYHQYVVACDDRDGLRAFLEDRGISTSIHYPAPVHRQPAYAGARTGFQRLAATDQIATQILSLPIFPQLSATEVQTVVDAILAWSRQ